MSEQQNDLRIILAGNPNSGKTSLFNQLTGLNQKISNLPGTTIENKEGKIKAKAFKAKLIDTPGTYSFSPKSIDEEEAVKFIGQEHPDFILYVADGSNLRRNMFYLSQLSSLEIPILLALNLMDVAKNKGLEIDITRLENELGIKVVPINARTGEGISNLKAQIPKQQFKCHHPLNQPKLSTQERYTLIDELLSKSLEQKSRSQLISHRIDAVLTHKYFGFPIFLLILFVIFQSVFMLAEYPMQWIEQGFQLLSEFLHQNIFDHWAKNLLINGLIAGLSGVLVFVPQIIILFFFIGLLEETGYMARVSFIMDKLLSGLGLSGKSVIPLMSGAACAIPAIMSTRTIENWKDRLITIMVTPLMSCSARLPVYTLLISMAIPSQMIFGIINLQALVLLAMYLLGTFAALFAAVVFKWIIKHKIPSFFIMELPLYHSPRWKNIAITCWQKTRSFIFEAGKVILLISMVLWFLASYKPHQDQTWQVQKTDQIEQSFAGKLGKRIEPVIKPLGFNWKIGIALITSFAAREVFVGTMSTIYSVGDEENFEQIRAKMHRDKNPDGSNVYSLAVILSLMIFYAFAMQCMSTLAVVYKETKSLKWPSIQFVYMTGLAYLASFVTYQLVSIL